MSRTINRQPFSVSTAAKNYPTPAYFVQGQFNGICDSKNDVSVDQRSFADAKNVYVDEAGVLMSRPPFVFTDDEGYLVDQWQFGVYGLKLYRLIVDRSTTPETKVVDPTDYSTPEALETLYFKFILRCFTHPTRNDYVLYVKVMDIGWDSLLKVTCAQIEDKIFVWFAGYDFIALNTKGESIGDEHTLFFERAAKYLYIPATKLIINGTETDLEDKNFLIDNTIRRYQYSIFSDIDFSLLTGAQVSVRVNGAFTNNEDKYLYGISVTEHDPEPILLYPYATISSVDTVDIIKTERATVTLKYNTSTGNMYVSFDNRMYRMLPQLPGVIGKPFLTKDGLCVIAFTKNWLMRCKLVAQETQDFITNEGVLQWVNTRYLEHAVCTKVDDTTNPATTTRVDIELDEIDTNFIPTGYFETSDNFAYIVRATNGSGSSTYYPETSLDKIEYLYTEWYMGTELKSRHFPLITHKETGATGLIYGNEAKICFRYIAPTENGNAFAPVISITPAKIDNKPYGLLNFYLFGSSSERVYIFSIIDLPVLKDVTYVASSGLNPYQTLENRKLIGKPMIDDINFIDIRTNISSIQYGSFVADGLILDEAVVNTILFGKFAFDYIYESVSDLPTVENSSGDSAIVLKNDERHLFVIQNNDWIDLGPVFSFSDTPADVIIDIPCAMHAHIGTMSTIGEVFDFKCTTIGGGIGYIDRFVKVGEDLTYLATKEYIAVLKSILIPISAHAPLSIFRISHFLTLPLPFDAVNVPLYVSNTLRVFRSGDELWTSELTEDIFFELDKYEGDIMPGLYVRDRVIDMPTIVPDNCATMSEYCFSFVKNNENFLQITSDRRDVEQNLLLYLPEENEQKFASKITNLHPLYEDTLGVFTDDSIWYVKTVTLSDAKIAYTKPIKSKIPFGCREGDAIITALDGKALIFPTNRGLAAMAPEDFVATTENTITYLSDLIQGEYQQFYNKNIVNAFFYKQNPTAICKPQLKLISYKYWILLYKYMDRRFYAFDTRTATWWKWEAQYPIRKLLVNKRLYALLEIDYNPTVYWGGIESPTNDAPSFSGVSFVMADEEMLSIVKDDDFPVIEDVSKYYDNTILATLSGDVESAYEVPDADNIVIVKYVTPIIHWYFVSQKLHFDAINNYKGIYGINTVLTGSDTIVSKLSTKIYRDRYNPEKNMTFEIFIDNLRTFVKHLNLMHVLNFQYRFENDVTKEKHLQKPLRLNSVCVKYEVKEAVR